MHAVLFLSQLLAITKIHVQVIALVLHGIQTNFILFIIWTGAHEIVYPSRIDSREIIFPVWDREVKNHTLSNGTSPYRPYKGVTPPPLLRPPRSFLVMISCSVRLKVLKITPQIIIHGSLLITESEFFLVCCNYVLISVLIVL